MAWSTPRTWAVNEVVTAANMNTYISDDLSWLGTARPHCQVRDASLNPGTGSWVNFSWDALTTNVQSMAVSSGSYITAPSAGFYLVGASATFDADATDGVRAIMLSSSTVGGGTVYAQSNTTKHVGNASGATVVTGIQLSSSGLVYLSAFVPNGFAGNITNARMWAIWMTT